MLLNVLFSCSAAIPARVAFWAILVVDTCGGPVFFFAMARSGYRLFGPLRQFASVATLLVAQATCTHCSISVRVIHRGELLRAVLPNGCVFMVSDDSHLPRVLHPSHLSSGPNVLLAPARHWPCVSACRLRRRTPGRRRCPCGPRGDPATAVESLGKPGEYPRPGVVGISASCYSFPSIALWSLWDVRFMNARLFFSP
jgi:hypothetical protein